MPTMIVPNAMFTKCAISLADEAEFSLLLIQYLFIVEPHPSHPAPRIAAALWNAAERGVLIRILLNRFAHGRADRNKPRKPPIELCHRNIDLRYHTSGQVLHSKIIIADAEKTLTGSHNLSHWSLTRAHNMSLLILDTNIASQLLSIYNPLFARANRATL